MDVNRTTMTLWVEEALHELGGSATILNICKKVWEKHGEEIRNSGDMFYKWQYEIRWSGDTLRKNGVLIPAKKSPKGIWELT